MARTYDAAHIGWNHKGSSFEKSLSEISIGVHN